MNTTMLHLAVAELPFGGVGPSGTGAYHGERGSCASPTADRCSTRVSGPTQRVLYPPYGRWKQRLLRALL
ncbi:MAG: hypothetical protein R2755_28900 [Acidimicrobiales bacterium]